MAGHRRTNNRCRLIVLRLLGSVRSKGDDRPKDCFCGYWGLSDGGPSRQKKLRTAVCDERLVTVDEPLLDDDIRVVVTALSSDDAS